MGDIGHEVLAHAQQPVEMGYVPGQDEVLVLGHGHAAQLQTLALYKGGAEFGGGVRRLLIQQPDGIRMAQQGAKVLAGVLALQVQQGHGGAVEALDVALPIHQDGGIRQRRRHAPEVGRLLQGFVSPPPRLLEGAAQRAAGLLQAGVGELGAPQRFLGPAHESAQVPMLVNEPGSGGGEQRPAHAPERQTDGKGGQHQGPGAQQLLAAVEVHQAGLNR